eukprot:gene15318-16895_t
MDLGQDASPVIGIAILGVGRAGTIHFENCVKNKRVNLRYLVDIDVEKASKLVTDYRLKDTQAVGANNLQKVLDDSLVKGIIIATFTTVHEDQIKQCVEKGKAIFCEKPIAATLEKTESCFKLAEEKGVPLMCAFNRRFDPTHAQVRAGVLQGKVGQLQMIKTCSRDSPKLPVQTQKCAGGIFQDSTIHDIDLVMWIAGERPLSIYAQAHAFRQDFADIADVDTLAVTMKFPSGVIAIIDQSRFAAYGYDQRLEAFGDAGMLQSKNQNPTSVCHSDGRGVCDDVIMYSFPQRYATAYENELNHFLDVIEGSDCIITKQDVLAASRVAQACQQSHEIGQSIKLSW